jgi:hypothetical protein
VQWLFTAGGAALPKGRTEIFNMRTQTAADIASGLQRPELQPNLVEVAPKPPTLPETVSP